MTTNDEPDRNANSYRYRRKPRAKLPECDTELLNATESTIRMKILMVLTSHDKLGNTGRKTGFWLEEFAAPYFTFLDAGATVTLASPTWGQPPLDPVSALRQGPTELTLAFKQDPAPRAGLANTLRLRAGTDSD